MSERVDLVDSGGSVQLKNVARERAEDHPELHMQIVIVVIFNSKGEVLVHQRSASKKVNPGNIDHICGGVISGETPEQAAIRETREEAGVEISALTRVLCSVNKYNRYRWLFAARSDAEPILSEPDDIQWVAYKSVTELATKRETGDYTFVDDFFEETILAQKSLEVSA